jgi:hypothetical protein
MFEYLFQCAKFLDKKTSEACAIVIIFVGWSFIKNSTKSYYLLIFGAVIISIGVFIILITSIWYLVCAVSNHRGEIEKTIRENNDSHWKIIMNRANKQNDKHAEKLLSLSSPQNQTISENKLVTDISFKTKQD